MDRFHGWLLILIAAACTAMPATGVTVTLTSDEYSAAIGTGCSVREAIESINTGASFGDCDFSVEPTIVRLGTGTYALSLAGRAEDANQTGDLDVMADMAIIGDGPSLSVLDGNDVDRVLDILSGTVQLESLTVTGGQTQDGTGTSLDWGGGIRNAGTLSITSCWIDRNQAGSSSSSSDDVNQENRGGGIYSSGDLTLSKSTISRNTARGVNGNNSTTTGSSASGGGIYLDGAMLDMRNCTISGNSAQGGDGASSGAGGNGGAGAGGGLMLADNGSTGNAAVTLNSVTCTSNQAAGGAAGAGSGSPVAGTGSGGGLRVGAGMFEAGNSILAANTADSGADCSASGGTLSSLGYNVLGSSGCAGDESGDVVVSDPGLGSLADNGGATRTHALLSTSVALLAGSPTTPGEPGPPPGCESTDQRDTSRPQNGRCDVGALEKADLAITSHRVDPADSPVAGKSAQYTISFVNRGSDFAFSTTLTDTLPTGMTLTQSEGCLESPSAGTDSDGNVVCTIGTLAPQISKMVIFDVMLDPTMIGTVTNLAQLTSTTDGISAVTNAFRHEVVGEATLTISHTPLTTLAAFGGLVEYLIVVENSGPSTARDVVVTDVLNSGGLTDPDPTTGLAPLSTSSTSGCVEDPIGGRDASGNPFCTLDKVEPGVPKQFTLTAEVGMLDDGDGSSPGTQLSSEARLSSSTCPDSTTTCSQPLATVVTAIDVQTDADLSVTKTDNTLTAVVGQSVSYTIVVSNQIGPNNATGIEVTDEFPDDLDCFWRCTPAGGAVCTTQQTQGDIREFDEANQTGTVSLPVGASATYVADCLIDSDASAGSLSNTATITLPTGITDADTANNTGFDTTTLTREVNLGITKSDGVTIATPGDNVVYTIEVSNALGPSDAVAAQVTDTFDSVLLGCTWTCAEAGGASCGAASGSGDLNETVNVPVGGTVTYTVSCTLDETIDVTVISSYQNTATVTAPSNATETFPDDNVATDETTLVERQSDLSVTATASPTSVLPGESLAVTFNVANAGPQSANSVVLTSVLPSGVTFVSASLLRPNIFTSDFESATTSAWGGAATGGGTCIESSGTVTCSLGDLISGGTATVTLTVTVDATTTGSLTFSGTVSATETDGDTANDTAGVTVTVTTELIDLVLSLSDSPDPVSAGGTLVYTLVTTNSGTGEATSVVLEDALPPEVTFLSASSGCTLSGNLVQCDLGSLAVGASVSRTIRVAVDADATLAITNPASVSGAGSEAEPGDNTATEVTTIQ